MKKIALFIILIFLNLNSSEIPREEWVDFNAQIQVINEVAKNIHNKFNSAVNIYNEIENLQPYNSNKLNKLNTKLYMLGRIKLNMEHLLSIYTAEAQYPHFLSCQICRTTLFINNNLILEQLKQINLFIAITQQIIQNIQGV